MKPSQRRRGCNRSKLAPSHRHFLCRISVPAPSCRLHPAGAGHDTLSRKSRKAAGHAGKRLGQSVPRSWLACPARIRGSCCRGRCLTVKTRNGESRRGRGPAVTSHTPLNRSGLTQTWTPRLIVAVALWVGVLNPVHVRGGPSMRVQGPLVALWARCAPPPLEVTLPSMHLDEISGVGGVPVVWLVQIYQETPLLLLPC